MITHLSGAKISPVENSGISQLLLVHHVARRLGLSCRMVRHLAETKKLPGFKAGIKIWKFLPADVEEYRAQREANDV